MSRLAIEVIYGKHIRYEVIRNRGFFGDTYTVRMSNGKYSGTFSRLDRAVQWAYQQAKTR